MRTLGMVMLDILGDQIIEVLLTTQNEVVESILLQALDEPFDVGLQVARTLFYSAVMSASRMILSKPARQIPS